MFSQIIGQEDIKARLIQDAENGRIAHAILFSGPSGCGKSTTLYSFLKEVNDSKVNIVTVEDPVEFTMNGINQTQVNAKANMTFAAALRSILRQDPDIIMIGEIRDEETAEIAMRMAITGHLVLSTLHTNTAVGAITRLNDMGIESYLLSTSPLNTSVKKNKVILGQSNHTYAYKNNAPNSNKEYIF